MTDLTSSDQWREAIVRGQDQIRDEIRELRIALLGDGRTVPGVMTRLDRIEQIQDSRKWQMRAIVGGFIGVAIKWIWDFVASGKNFKP